ncbi:MAG: 1,5-anhydro-D-fructose reductase [Bacteroidetes bacterium ADurb.Bin174]|jgi:predicted dehydrogenase|nr:MAG: 1,5-anhydro-D-fructose reductase [Bacteroidetes bacterium ADurb.Bin174]
MLRSKVSSNNNSKIRFGVVGTNFITDWLIADARQDERFELVAVYSRTQETADAFAIKHQIPHTFISMEAMAQSDLIDAVYIASPNFLHAQQSILFMNHGKHVLCEKSLASNYAEVSAMVETAKRNQVVLMEAMKPTLTPNFRTVIKNLPKVGVLRHYFASFCQYSSRYDKFKAGIPVNAFNPEYSNGATMDIGIYTIYPMVVLFGKPRSICAQGVLLTTGVDAVVTVNFEYSQDFTATVIYSKISDSILPAEIQGEKGNLVLDRIHTIRKVQFIPGGVASMGKGMLSEPEDLSVPTEKGEYYYEVKEFIDLIHQQKNESDINTHENSLLTIEIMDEIRRQLGVVFPADSRALL